MAERVEDLNLPNSVVTRIIKDSLPAGVNVSKEARTAIARAASVFVLYLTSTSNNVSMLGNRKTISANDVFKALDETGFDVFAEPLKEYLDVYKSSMQSKKRPKKDGDAKGDDENLTESMETAEDDGEEDASEDEADEGTEDAD